MAVQRTEIYKCEGKAHGGCPMMVEVLVECDCENGCEMTCCGDAMKRLDPKTADVGKEKHVPVIEKVDGGYKVKVGDVPHPMEGDHWIQWIELHAGKKVYREYLDPHQAPEATFLLKAGSVTAREHCNKHGLWKG